MSGGIGSIVSGIFGGEGGGGGLVGSLLGGSSGGGGQQENGFGSFNKATYGPGVDIASGMNNAKPQDQPSLGTLLGAMDNNSNGLRMAQQFSGMQAGLGADQPQNPGMNSLMSMAMANASQGHRQPYAFRSAYLQRLLERGRL